MKKILFLVFVFFNICAYSQGSETFVNIPAASATYSTRTWTGDDAVTWTATLARTDQTLTGKAICTNGSGTVTSPTYTGGMGTLSFNYVRGFTGTSARSFTVWVNGTQIGGTTTVNATSNTVVLYSTTVNVSGNVSLEIRTAGAQIKIDDIAWTSYTSCSSPSTQASAFGSSSITTNSGTASWTRGNGNNVLVVARAGGAVTADPASGTSYTANATFGSGTQIGTGNYVVYDGTGTSVNVTGLSSGTTYHFAVYEYNTTGTCYNLTELTGNFTTTVITPDIVLSSPSPAVAPANITQGTNNNVIYRFDLAVTTANATLTGVTITTAGTYAASNITNLKCWYSADATFSSGTDVLLSTKTTTLGPGSHVFPTFINQTINSGSSGYFFITTDLPCAATNANTISVNAITSADLTYVLGNETGTANAGGTQTIISATPNNVTAPATSACNNAGTTVSWTAPTGCSDNVLVFAKAGSFSLTPTGDGSSYTANTVFGSGTAFDGGFCVYKGTGTSVSISGLTNGTNYTYKIFTRNDNNWSSGVSTNCTPTIAFCTAGTTNSGFEFIDRVIINTIDNSSSGDGQYQDFTSLSTTVEKGLTYNLTIYNGNSAYSTDRTKVYIDYNNSGIFNDAGEAIGTSAQSIGPYTYAITIPLTAVTGSVRMRIRLEDAGYATADSCGNAAYGEVEDYTLNIIPQCVSTASITSFLPTSGSPGAIVTITGTGFTGATGVKFNGVNATTYTVVNSTTITAEVPAGTSLGKIKVLDASSCAATSATDFTFLNTSGTCVTNATDLIISEVFDAQTGNNHYIEIYNGTGASINLDSPNDYQLYLSTATDIDITGTIADGATLVVYAGVDGDSKATSSINFGSGFNENDYIRLKKGGTVIDEVRTPNYVGFTMIRNNTITSPKNIYDATQWTITDHSSSTSGSTIGNHSIGANNTPTISVHPADITACTFNMSVSASGPSLTYQWKFNDPSSMTGWLNLTATNLTSTNPLNTGITLTGATSNTISLSGNLANLYNYQIYCEVTSSGTCTKSSNTAQVIYNTRPVYRSVTAANGNWTNVALWEMATTTAGPWIAACSFPIALNSSEVIIQNGTKIILDIDNTIDKITIEPTGELEILPTSKLNVLNSNTGADLIVNGTLYERSSSGNGIIFEDNSGTSNDASWILGSSAKIIKTNTASVVKYRDFYQGGISTIPATADWYFRNNGDGAPITNAVGMYYPNLHFENAVSGNYNWSSSLLTLVGASDYCRVKGNLNIGMSGIGTCTVINNNINATPMLVEGNLNINSGSTFTNASYNGASSSSHGNGTGLNIKGNMTINGTYNFNNTIGLTKLSGTTNQTISSTASGVLQTYNFELDNTSHANVSGINVDVYNTFTFTNGKIITIIATPDVIYMHNQSTSAFVGGVTSGASKYVEGKIRWTTAGTGSYTFPVGHSTQNAQGFTITPTGASGSDILGYLEPNTTSPVQPIAYCDVEKHPAASGVVNIGSGLSGTDGILDQITFNISSPLQWDVTNPGGGISSYNITVHANGGQDINPITSVNSLAIRYLLKNGEPGNTGFTTGDALPSFSATGFIACPNGYSLSGMNSFSKFTLNGANAGSTTLPVTLTSFNVIALENNTANLVWTTSSEINNDKFIIERSIDAMNYISIGEVKGNGNSTQVHTYNFVDRNPKNGINYYRLKQVDFDSKYEYSPTKTALFKNNNTVNVVIYPNPSTNNFNVELTNIHETISFVITDLLGKVIYNNLEEVDAEKNPVVISIDNIPSGNYILSIKGNSVNEKIKLIKQ